MGKKRYLWLTILGTVICLASLSMPVYPVEKKSSDGKVAVVNGAPITQVEVEREMMLINQQIAGSGRSYSDSQLLDIRKKVLEKLINQELLYQESRKKGFQVGDEAVNEQFDDIKKRFPGETEFKTALLKMKTSEDELKSQLRKGMTIKRFVDEEFFQKTTIPEKELKAFYDGHPDSFKEPEQVRASHILIKTDPGRDESKMTAARDKIRDAQRSLEKGEDFGAVAKKFSEDPSGANGGDLGYFSRGQMVKPFEDAAFALNAGQVSDIIETQYGYHLIKVMDKKPAGTIAYDEIKEKLENYLKQQKVQEEVNSYIEKLKGQGKVEKFQ